MKRMILSSILTAAGLMAQATGAQSGSAPATPQTSKPAVQSNAQSKAKKHRRAKNKKPAMATQSGTKAAAKSDASKTPVKK